METAPMNATWVQVKTAAGDILESHFATRMTEGDDAAKRLGLSGPPFKGWWVDDGTRWLKPISSPPVAWRACLPNDQAEPRGPDRDSRNTPGQKEPNT
jgi:hypothetical protein